MKEKPNKKTDKELFEMLVDKIIKNKYIFLRHATKRLKDRSITDLEVLEILEGKKNRQRGRNKAKDKYEIGKRDWNYCIEGINLDGIRIRVIFSFENDLLLIITVIRIAEVRQR